MQRVETLIVGAGQTGLAMSRCLSERSIDHVLIERGEVANSWRSERWDSLRLLTPNWLSRLPGSQYEGDDPDGYMTMPEIVDYIAKYAQTIHAPVKSHTEVTSVDTVDDGFEIRTTDGEWRAKAVVVASGPYHRADVPTCAESIPPTVTCIAAADYRNPDQLDDGGVLVVGAASTGVQLAQEIQLSGRQVTLAVGGHVRMPRVYRGLDIMRWLDGAGVLDERFDEVDDIVRARHVSSFQLVGSPERLTVDLNSLQDIGVRLVGRLGGITDDGIAQFSGSLPNQCDAGRPQARTSARQSGRLGNRTWFRQRDRSASPVPANTHPGGSATSRATRQARYPDDRLGDGLPTRVSVASDSNSRHQRRSPPHRWRHLYTRVLLDGDNLPATKEVNADCRRR